MKKQPVTVNGPLSSSILPPVPSSYAFDDTPKAFKRMLQRKNGDQEAYKKSKQEQSFKRTLESTDQPAHQKQRFHDSQPSPSQPSQTTQPALSTGFKTVRAKRKAHLQSRDLKKKLKRFDATRDLPFHSTHTRKHVRDVVQEPPKLHQLKKTFKKVKDEKEELKSWSDYEDELEAEEFEKTMNMSIKDNKNKLNKKNKFNK